MRRIDIDPRAWPRIAWSWKATALIERGDVTRKDGDDYAARLYVTFRLPPGRMSPLERAELRMARALVGDHVPDAGLSYIWDARAPVGTIVANAYTDRVKMIVVESGRERLGRWIDYERDLAADWRAAFGGDIPPISGIAIMTDADNTGESARTFYGDIVSNVAPGRRGSDQVPGVSGVSARPPAAPRRSRGCGRRGPPHTSGSPTRAASRAAPRG